LPNTVGDDLQTTFWGLARHVSLISLWNFTLTPQSAVAEASAAAAAATRAENKSVNRSPPVQQQQRTQPVASS